MPRDRKKTELNMELSLLVLMCVKPFEEITVTELCQTCGVGRSTFYNTFTGLADCRDKMFAAFAHHQSAEFSVTHDLTSGLSAFLTRLSRLGLQEDEAHEANRVLTSQYSLLLSSFGDRIGPVKGKTKSSEGLSAEYCLAACIGVFSAVFAVWQKNGFKDSSRRVAETLLVFFDLIDNKMNDCLHG